MYYGSVQSRIVKLAQSIAYDQNIDGYSIWRMSRDIGNDLFSAKKKLGVIPIELARLHLILSTALKLREDMHARAG